MGSNSTLPDEVVLPDDFDGALDVYYGKVIHPEDINELACQIASVLEDEDVSVAQVERVLREHNTTTLTPAIARQLAAEVVHLHHEERQNAGPDTFPKVACEEFTHD